MSDRTVRPYLLFPQPQPVPLAKRRGGGGGRQPQLPSYQRQQQRVDKLLSDIQSAFETRRAALQATVAGVAPEEVVVFETIGSIEDFSAAVARIDGLEWLAEFFPSKVDPDDDFFFDDDHERQVDQTIYLTLANHAALERVVALWRDYKRNQGQSIERNYAAFRQLFGQVRDIRFWDREDRLKGTHLRENLRSEVEHGAPTVTFESELWFRTDDSARTIRARAFADSLSNAGGRTIANVVIEPIAYHAFLCEVPRNLAMAILDDEADLAFLDHSSVQYFRPSGQISVHTLHGDSSSFATSVDLSEPVRMMDAQVALLDGLPLENHQWLRTRIQVDDPDGWSATYPASERHHGTAMASLLALGDAGSGDHPSLRPIYVRPILRPVGRDLNGSTIERMPTDRLSLDLIHSAFRRMFEDSNEGPSVAPDVKVINFSIGNDAVQFDREISAWARLFDWLSWRYNVLIMVSVGNYLDSLELGLTNAQLESLDAAQLSNQIVKSTANQIQQRRLLAPSEAVNVLSVGALHLDESGVDIDPRSWCDDAFLVGQPSPLNRLGHGYGRSLKPDILMPGGRQLYRPRLGMPSSKAVLQRAGSPNRPPGQLVAAPGANPGQTDSRVYSAGTSNATALGSRRASEIIDVLREIDIDAEGTRVPDEWLPVMAKTLLVHSAGWKDSHAVYSEVITENTVSRNAKAFLARFLGFGSVDAREPLECSEHRVTVLGYGAFDSEGTHAFHLPIPSLFRTDRIWKRLTLTLSWLTPVNPRDRRYRRAVLSLDPSMKFLENSLGLKVVDGDARATRHGTVQHIRLEGGRRSRLADIDDLELKVMCNERAGGIREDWVRYAVAVSIEVKPALDVRLYEEIATRIRQPVPVHVSSRA